MNKAIVITSISPPTKAVEQFEKIQGWQLIIVADEKTPPEWYYDNVVFLSLRDQQTSGGYLFDVLPLNHYCRKMIGYIEAIRSGANTIVDSDDDNIPKANWSIPPFTGFYQIASNKGFTNIYKLFTNDPIWPRGFPLKQIYTAIEPSTSELVKKDVSIGIWQGLADGDPDVDAIYRLTNNKPCFFNDREPVVLASKVVCPFNSQNTAFCREAFPLLYLPATVTFRFTDILRGYVAQPILWTLGLHLGFTGATVVQERNKHDYLQDFKSEIPCYLYPEKIIDTIAPIVHSRYSVEDNLYESYRALLGAGIVQAAEMIILEAWLKDIAGLQKRPYI
ncbi:STELLO glycosyltransferase family protein [Pelosinus sp. UFO1]|uniref:STELLO glycosyltransferase family protein n=1 Tax=Pelosinus sp. UFO1 TaxID=484770 RepID=UPI0004D1A69B|nr:STELLO glycosyltransferase family protein [Pelosinus sp. UFO1]AIF52452.1 Protein of unknown function DUF288 [Pelosinus sp. UFO1]